MNIDEALRAYVDRTPPLGMEARVMRRVSREHSRPRWWLWMAPGLVAAACLVAMWLRPAVPVRRAIPTAAAWPMPRPAEKPVRRAEAPRHKRHRESEAQVLWRFTQAHPEAAIHLTAQYEPPPVTPLQIQPITIEELGNQ